MAISMPQYLEDLIARQKAEIERLQDAKRRALAIADKRVKENAALRADNVRLRAELAREKDKWETALLDARKAILSGAVKDEEVALNSIDTVLGAGNEHMRASTPTGEKG